MVTTCHLFNIDTCFGSIEFAIFLLKYLHKFFLKLFNSCNLKCLYQTDLSFSLNWESAMVNTKYCFKLHVNPPYIEAISPYHFTIFNEIQVIHLSPNILFLSHSPKILLFLINGEENGRS